MQCGIDNSGSSRFTKDLQEFVSWLSGENLKKKKMKKKAKEMCGSSRFVLVPLLRDCFMLLSPNVEWLKLYCGGRTGCKDSCNAASPPV